MLHVQTVERNTLVILKELMSCKQLQSFLLVGGTALSLKYGHRKSVDLDLFSTLPFENETIKEFMLQQYPHFRVISREKAPGVFGYLEELKIDLVKYHHYKIIYPPDFIDGIRFMSTEDIAAMKVFALYQRAKKKDFWDMSLLLDIYGLDRIIEFYVNKFPDNTALVLVPQVLIYFDEAEGDEDPVCLKGLSWTNIKTNITKHVNKYLK